MTASTLRLAPTLALPLEAVTQTFGVLAKRGMGKSYLAAVLSEELLGAGLQVCVVDPVGVFWGLRAGADGKGPGLPIVVLGGDHADAPLEVTAGELMATLVVDERLSVVLDLSRFRKGEQTRFMTDFAERLYHHNRAPLHLVLDEADAFAPQRPQRGQERLLGAIEDLVRRGRARGLGVTLVTQRAAVLNKDVLTQVEVLIALRTIAPQDREAIDAWIRVHGTPEQRDELMRSLPSLPVGTAWVWSPGWLDLFRKVAIRPRRTFDSSATPTVGKRPVEPAQLAPVDLDRLRTRLAATLERAAAEDPRRLRQRIAELERQLATPAPAPPVERVEVPVVSPAAAQAIAEAVRTVTAEGAAVRAAVEAAFTAGVDRVVEAARPALAALGALHVAGTGPVERTPRRDVAAPHRGRVPAPVAPGRRPASAGPLAGGERRILTVLAQYPGGRTKTQVAILAVYATNGGGFNNYLSALRTRGLIAGTREHLQITSAGLAALGPVEPLPRGRALVDHWLASLGKAERAILQHLVAIAPRACAKAEVAAACGYDASGGGFNNAVSRLRTLELIDGRGELRASETLWE